MFNYIHTSIEARVCTYREAEMFRDAIIDIFTRSVVDSAWRFFQNTYLFQKIDWDMAAGGEGMIRLSPSIQKDMRPMVLPDIRAPQSVLIRAVGEIEADYLESGKIEIAWEVSLRISSQEILL